MHSWFSDIQSNWMKCHGHVKLPLVILLTAVLVAMTTCLSCLTGKILLVEVPQVHHLLLSRAEYLLKIKIKITININGSLKVLHHCNDERHSSPCAPTNFGRVCSLSNYIITSGTQWTSALGVLVWVKALAWITTMCSWASWLTLNPHISSYWTIVIPYYMKFSWDVNFAILRFAYCVKLEFIFNVSCW